MELYQDLKKELVAQYEPVWAVLWILGVYWKIANLSKHNLLSPELARNLIEVIHHEVTTESLHHKKNGPLEEL